MFKRNPKAFLRFVTVDETWIHHYTSETKEQSKQWTKSGESVPKKAKTANRPERSWPPFFGIREALFSPTIWRREGQSRDTVLIYWTDSTLN